MEPKSTYKFSLIHSDLSFANGWEKKVLYGGLIFQSLEMGKT